MGRSVNGNFEADTQAMSLPGTIHYDELSAAKVSISLSIDHLLRHVPLAVAASGTAEASCGNLAAAAAKYVLVLFSLIVTSLPPPPPHGTSTPLVSVSVN